MTQRMKCPACNSLLMTVIVDYETWHVDIFCGICGQFVSHFDAINPEFFTKLQMFMEKPEGIKLPEEIDLEDIENGKKN